jgi:hypothetical protein
MVIVFLLATTVRCVSLWRARVTSARLRPAAAVGESPLPKKVHVRLPRSWYTLLQPPAPNPIRTLGAVRHSSSTL